MRTPTVNQIESSREQRDRPEVGFHPGLDCLEDLYNLVRQLDQRMGSLTSRGRLLGFLVLPINEVIPLT